jgi:RNA polymerase sigma-70 factor, ECF subfamily
VHEVYRYALGVLQNEADAEDVAQTAFLNAYRAFQRGQRPMRPHNWLIKITHNVCRERFRESSRRPREVELDEGSVTATVDHSGATTAGEIRHALGFLGLNQRAALVMRELEGRSHAEIAQTLDISVGAVETLLVRARRALREQLEGGLTCREAELTISRLSHRRLSSSERGALRSHLRECKDCAVVERRQRAQRAALASLAAVPLPASLATFFGAGAAGTGVAAGGAGIGTKIAAVLAGGLIVTGAARETIQVVGPRESAPSAARSVLGDRLSSGPRTERRERGVRLPPRRADPPAAPRRADPRPSRRGYAGPNEKTRNPADGEDRGSVGTMLHPTLQLPAPTQDTLQGADRPVQGSPVALRLP